MSRRTSSRLRGMGFGSHSPFWNLRVLAHGRRDASGVIQRTQKRFSFLRPEDLSAPFGLKSQVSSAMGIFKFRSSSPCLSSLFSGNGGAPLFLGKRDRKLPRRVSKWYSTVIEYPVVRILFCPRFLLVTSLVGFILVFERSVRL